MVGSADWFADPFPVGCTPGKDCLLDPKLNIATYNQGRQPGSAFKPFVYAVAFDKGAGGETTVIDEETNFGVWGGKEYIPQNYDEKFHGEVTLREALAQSLNIPAVKVLLTMAGIEDSVAFAKKLGMETLRDPSFYGPALVLGGGEVRLLDIVSAYGVFATEGKKIPPLSILEIQDSAKNTLEKNRHTGIQVMRPEVAREITNILSDNDARAPLFGIRSPLYIDGFNVAAKTGTTQEYKDAWTIGYTKNIVAGVWAGNNDNTPSDRQPGGALASPLWNTFMAQALPYLNTHPISYY
jgi:membrane peptidoglycan carboxypeptidase